MSPYTPTEDVSGPGVSDVWRERGARPGSRVPGTRSGTSPCGAHRCEREIAERIGEQEHMNAPALIIVITAAIAVGVGKKKSFLARDAVAQDCLAARLRLSGPRRGA